MIRNNQASSSVQHTRSPEEKKKYIYIIIIFFCTICSLFRFWCFVDIFSLQHIELVPKQKKISESYKIQWNENRQKILWKTFVCNRQLKGAKYKVKFKLKRE